jgi:hypothetical protein
MYFDIAPMRLLSFKWSTSNVLSCCFLPHIIPSRHRNGRACKQSVVASTCGDDVAKQDAVARRRTYWQARSLVPIRLATFTWPHRLPRHATTSRLPTLQYVIARSSGPRSFHLGLSRHLGLGGNLNVAPDKRRENHRFVTSRAHCSCVALEHTLHRRRRAFGTFGATKIALVDPLSDARIGQSE